MDLARINFLSGQDLPSEGACPRCRRPGAHFREYDPNTEDYIVQCAKCGKYLCPKDELEDFLGI